MPRLVQLSALLVLVAALLSSGSGAADAQETLFPPFGASGDRMDADACPAGQFLVGVHGRGGDWVDALQPVCGRVKDVSVTSGNVLSFRGGSGGGSRQFFCDPNQVVTFIQVFLTTDKRRVWGIELRCETVRRSAKAALQRSQGALLGKGGQMTGGGISGINIGPIQEQKCPSGQFGNGLTVRSGKDVNAVGLRCTVLPPLPDPTLTPVYTGRRP